MLQKEKPTVKRKTGVFLIESLKLCMYLPFLNNFEMKIAFSICIPHGIENGVL